MNKKPGNWISVDEALPGLGQIVIVADGDFMGFMVPLESHEEPSTNEDPWEWLCVDVPFWNQNSCQWECPTSYANKDVHPTHWMPLPVPPAPEVEA